MKSYFKYLAAVVLFFSIFLVPLIDTDFGWHYRCGAQIVEQGRLCSTNTFTTLLDGFHWNSPSQGYQLLIYSLYRLGGFPLISILYGLSAALTFLFFLESLKGNLWLKVFFFLPLVFFAWIALDLGLRSQILTVYFFAIFLGLVERSSSKPKILFLTVPLMWIWANSHPGFFLGLIVSLFLLIDQFELWLTQKFKLRQFGQILLIIALNFAVTWLNPFGLGIYQEAWRHIQVPLRTLIVEWLPSLLWQKQLIVVTGVMALFLILRFGEKKLFRILTLGLTAYLAVDARRSLPLFSLGLTYTVFEPKIAQKIDHLFSFLSKTEMLTAILLPALIYFLIVNTQSSLAFSQTDYCRRALVTMPCAAVDFLKSQKKGNVFNAYEWGGFLEWQLPRFKFFVDGRMPTWDTTGETHLPTRWRGKSPYTVYLETTQTQPGWEEVLKNFSTDYLLITPGNALDLLLAPDPGRYGYRSLFRDDISVVYEKV